MRDYGRVFSSFWQSPEIRALPEDARTLALYLLTTPHGNLVGCFRLPEAYVAEDLQWPSERVSEGFRNLSESHFIVRDECTKWLLITKYIKWNGFENPNVAKAAQRAFEQVHSLSLKAALALNILEFGAHLSEGFAKGCETLAKPFRNPEPEPEPIQSLTRTRTRTRAKPLSPGAADAPPAAPSAGVWSAYADAYRSRYGAEPVRNAKVNGQLAQLVARLGAEEAPGVARFFVGHQGAMYVRAMHPVDLLLRDAEGLRTAWATGRQVTQAQAAQVDRTQTNLNAFAPLIAEARAKESKNENAPSIVSAA